MEGDIAPLPEIIALCERYNASVLVDDAHAFGVIGQQGRGTASHFGLTDKTDLIMGTFSKTFGSLGGFVAGDSEVINYIKHCSRTLIFSASLPPANVAAVSKAIDIMLEEPERMEHLWVLTHHAHAEFKARGFDIGNTQSPIIPLFVRDPDKVLLIVRMALEEGIFVTPVLPPAVPADSVIIRFALMATHSMDQLDKAIAILTKLFKKMGVV